MSTNPFDDESGTFHVLLNDRGEYSLWPDFLAVPDGWRAVLESATRDAATDYVEEHWTTLNLRDLAAAGRRASTTASATQKDDGA